MADDGLDLNIVSVPAAAARPTACSKRRGSGKAWDKKNKKHKKTRDQGVGNQPPRDSSKSNAQASSHASETNGPQVNGKSTPPTAGRRDTSALAATLKPAGRENGSTGKDVVGRALEHSAAADATTNSNTTAATGSENASSARRREELPHSTAVLSQGDHAAADGSPKPRTKPGTDGGNAQTREPSNERRRVLEMARRDTTPRRAAPGEEKQKGGTKRGPASSSSSSIARPVKRKRPGVGPPVSFASAGVVDFTGGDTAKNADATRPDKNRRAAAAAAAVAKATAAMAKAGSKWWDDDDDDHVVVAKAKTGASNHGAAGFNRGGEKDIEEDKDGGLPSDVHPNSVRTKAVDMDREASNAMGILAALLDKGGGEGVGGGEESTRRVKNGGKSKKKKNESAEPAEKHDMALRLGEPSGFEDTTAARVMDVDNADTDGEGANAGAGLKNEGKNQASAGGAAGGGDEGVRGNVSRKNRGRANAVGEREGGGGDGGNVPLPEYHARPRELSRRAAVRPLASARSAHVMAAGPGATFAALGMPPKMVSHLEEPKGDTGGGGMGLVGPTVCQLAAVPVLAAGHNTVVKSETGSGKTLAYLLPMLCDLASVEPRVEREKGTLAIVLAPTRELSAQILEVRPGLAVLCTKLWTPDGNGKLDLVRLHLRDVSERLPRLTRSI